MSNAATEEMAVLGYVIYARNEDAFWAGVGYAKDSAVWTANFAEAKRFTADLGCVALDAATSHLLKLRAEGWDVLIIVVLDATTSRRKKSRRPARADRCGESNGR